MTDDEYMNALRATDLEWIASRITPCFFDAIFEGEHVQIRLNDFPDEPIMTLFFRGREVDIEESPKSWRLVHND